MTLPTTLQVSGAGSSKVNGTYVRDGDRWKQSNGSTVIGENYSVKWETGRWRGPKGLYQLRPQGWYLGHTSVRGPKGMVDMFGMYFAEGAHSTFPTGGWKVYTGPTHNTRDVACAPAPCFAEGSLCGPAPRVAKDPLRDPAPCVAQGSLRGPAPLVAKDPSRDPAPCAAKVSKADMQHAVVQLPKVFKDKFTWDFVKEVVLGKVKDNFFDVLLAPFGLHGLAKTVVVEVINGVCHIYYRKVVEKKPISRSFLVDTVKEALQTSVRKWGFDVAVGDLFGKTVKDDFNSCMDAVQAASDVAKDELEYAEKSLRYGDHYYRVLDDTHPDEKMLGTQSEALQIPMGWEIVTETADIVANVIARHEWGTHIVVFGNGAGYQTALPPSCGRRAGVFWRGGLLTKSGSYYKPTTNSIRILIRQRA